MCINHRIEIGAKMRGFFSFTMYFLRFIKIWKDFLLETPTSQQVLGVTHLHIKIARAFLLYIFHASTI